VVRPILSSREGTSAAPLLAAPPRPLVRFLEGGSSPTELSALALALDEPDMLTREAEVVPGILAGLSKAAGRSDKGARMMGL
jgi:hypothetical protein